MKKILIVFENASKALALLFLFLAGLFAGAFLRYDVFPAVKNIFNPDPPVELVRFPVNDDDAPGGLACCSGCCSTMPTPVGLPPSASDLSSQPYSAEKGEKMLKKEEGQNILPNPAP